MSDKPTFIEWAIGIGAALAAFILTLLGIRKRRTNPGGDGEERFATQLDLAKQEAKLLEADRMRAHEIYNRMQSLTTDYAMEDDKLMQRMEELFKHVTMRMDRHSQKLAEVAVDVAILKDNVASIKARFDRRRS